MQLQHLWHIGPGTSTALSVLTLPSSSSSAAPSLLICTCAGIYVWRSTLTRKKEKSFQFQPKNFQNHTFKVALKISETDSYPSPVTTECPESKTCCKPLHFQLLCPFPVRDLSFGRNSSAVPQLKYHLQGTHFHSMEDL